MSLAPVGTQHAAATMPPPVGSEATPSPSPGTSDSAAGRGAAALGGGGSSGDALLDAVRQLSTAVEALSRALSVSGGGPTQAPPQSTPQVGGGCGCSSGPGAPPDTGATGAPEAKPAKDAKGAKGAPEAQPEKPKSAPGGAPGQAPQEYAGSQPNKVGGETSYSGLQEKSFRVLSAAHDYGLKLISGHRPGDSGSGHSNGSAVDVSNTPGGSKQGSPEMEQFAEAMRAAGKAGDPNIGYVIYQQRIASARDGWAWRPMEDRGSNTQNHFDHVHVSTDPSL